MSKKELEVNIAFVIEHKLPSSIISLLLADAYSNDIISSDELITYHSKL